jgi:hypothetical protein
LFPLSLSGNETLVDEQNAQQRVESRATLDNDEEWASQMKYECPSSCAAENSMPVRAVTEFRPVSWSASECLRYYQGSYVTWSMMTLSRLCITDAQMEAEGEESSHIGTWFSYEALQDATSTTPLDRRFSFLKRYFFQASYMDVELVKELINTHFGSIPSKV